MTCLLARADARRIPLPDGSVQCCISSPPYFGLRDYGTAAWDGGDPGCDHVGPPMRTNNKPTDHNASFHGGATRANEPFRDLCGKCGARRVDRQIGLEASTAEFVAAMVAVFREVRRVLRDDGTCWLNLGDSYTSGNSGQRVRDSSGGFQPGLDTRTQDATKANPGFRPRNFDPGLKPKDLIGIPWRCAFALQADGWYLRSEIIWYKPNPMPESVTDRPTKSHEQVFLLAKSPTYYFDAEAVREKQTTPLHARQGLPHGGLLAGPMERLKADGTSASQYADRDRVWGNEAGRNIRSVWTIPSEPTPMAHFAVMPRKLVEPCVKAGTSAKGCCPRCGKAWGRATEGIKEITGHGGRAHPGNRDSSRKDCGVGVMYRTVNTTLGWQQSCPCPPAAPVPCLVLDPFSGAGTTGVVALALGRRYVGFDLSPEYLAMSRRRIERPHAHTRKVDKPMPLFAALEDRE